MGQISRKAPKYSRVSASTGLLRLFGHLYGRHKKRSWIRNTSSIDSDVLAALDLDRKLMREQDQAFTEALENDKKHAAVSITKKAEEEEQPAELNQQGRPNTAPKTMSREEIRAARLAALEK